MLVDQFSYLTVELVVRNAVVGLVHELKEADALVGVLLEHQADYLFAHLGDWRVARELQFALAYLLLRFLFGGAHEGQCPVQHRVEHEADGPDV